MKNLTLGYPLSRTSVLWPAPAEPASGMKPAFNYPRPCPSDASQIPPRLAKNGLAAEISEIN